VTSIDPQAAQRVQPELLPGESIYWAGMPKQSVIFHSDDWVTIPFSLMWTGFFIFWEAGALGDWGKATSGSGGGNWFMVLWGIPFLLYGNYLVWGRFLTDAWLKRRTFYAITNRRIFVLQQGWTKKTSTAFWGEIPTIEREGKATGTLWFGPKYPLLGGRGTKKRSHSRFSLGDVPVFADITDVDSVYALIMDLRGRESIRSTGGHTLTYNS
jgi:hypothetical protein